MNEESSESIFRKKLWKLPQPLVGAILGIFVFIILLLLTVVIGSELMRIILLSPGYLVLTIIIPSMGFGFNRWTFGQNTFIGLISSTPFIALGSLIASKAKVVKATGIFLLLMYAIALGIMGTIVIMLDLF
jgi:hypothetical protein